MNMGVDLLVFNQNWLYNRFILIGMLLWIYDQDWTRLNIEGIQTISWWKNVHETVLSLWSLSPYILVFWLCVKCSTYMYIWGVFQSACVRVGVCMSECVRIGQNGRTTVQETYDGNNHPMDDNKLLHMVSIMGIIWDTNGFSWK